MQKNIAKSSKQRTADKNGTDVASHASPVALRTESLGMAASAIKLSESYICHIPAAIKLSITRTALFRSQSQSPFHSDRPWGGLSRLQTGSLLSLIAHWPGLESKMREHLHNLDNLDNLHMYGRVWTCELGSQAELFYISVLH